MAAESFLVRPLSTLIDDFNIGSLQVPILTVEDLIVLKTLAGRLQDQADLEKIRVRQDELGVDWDYVERWKTKLDFPG